MAFTRGYDDKERVQQYLEREVDMCKYMVNVPGNGVRPSYIDDPHIRLQKFGGNLSNNVTNVNSGLIGIAGRLDTECVQKRNGNEQMIKDNYSEISFPVISKAITDEPRAIMPAWQIRDLEQNNWNYLHTNPQNHAEVLFENNLSSRILEKDSYNNACRNNPQTE
jgi:hypothetical protein